MILAAGLGTRLKPLTDTRPKALVELNGRTLLEITLTRLQSFGITEIIVNAHHFADQIESYLKSKNNFGLQLTISCEDELLDTGGGLKKAAWFFQQNDSHRDEPFVLHNVDVLTNIDLHAMRKFHDSQNALATLAVQTRETSRPLLFNAENQLAGRINGRGAEPELVSRDTAGTTDAREFRQGTTSVVPQNVNNESASAAEALQPLAFSGVHLISPRLLPQITESGIFSIIPTYLRLAATQKIQAFHADQYYWRDLGRPSDLVQAALDLEDRLIR